VGQYSTLVDNTAFVSNGKRKTVQTDDHTIPTALWAINLVIDAQANQVRNWKKTGGSNE
jgi:hypothetical protein